MEKTKPQLLPIGIVAQSFGVSENNIRRMEVAGLLTPAYISEQSKYRYYDYDNLSTIANILTLKSFGFINDDIRDFLKAPGNYSDAYEKLVEKQRAITLQLDKIGRRVKLEGTYHCETLSYSGTYCFARKVTMMPSIQNLSEFTQDILYDAVKAKYPIDYLRAVLIVTDCMDFRTYELYKEQELTFCVPMREKVVGDEIIFLPPSSAVSFTWNFTANDFNRSLPIIDQYMTSQSLKQSDTLRASYDVGEYMGKDIRPDESVLHLFVPFEQ